MDNVPDKLDRLIDGALAGYSDAEPLAGLEERVLNRARVTQARRRRLVGWGLGLAVAASVVVVVVIWTEPRPIAKKAPMDAIAELGPQIAPREAPVTPRRVEKVSRVKRLVRQKPLPKLEQFPAPSPLTAEERALVAFVQRDPNEAERIFSDLQKRTDDPIEIQPIQIEPLQDDGAR